MPKSLQCLARQNNRDRPRFPDFNHYKQTNLMRAIVYTKYGSPDVLQVKEVEKPKPEDDELLIKIHAAEATKAD